MGVGWAELARGGNAGRSAVVGGGMVINALNTFIVTTILPSVVRDIGGLRYFAWSTVLYVVASLLGGAGCAPLLRRIGVRHAYRVALLGFTAGSIACALAPCMPVLLAGRAAQGLFAGTLSALSFTIIRTLFAERLWPRALSVVSVAWGIATLLGPAVGGVFARREAGGGARLLPHGATRPGAPLCAVYCAMVLLMAATTPEIFVPYFLQTLHGMVPLRAGYLSALMAAGWTLGSMFSSGSAFGHARGALALGPLVLATGLAALALLMPVAEPVRPDLLPIGAGLLALRRVPLQVRPVAAQ